MSAAATVEPTPDRATAILDAALAVLASEGIGGVSMRAVARQAGVALGLVNYHFESKTALVAAALRRIGEQDLAIFDAGGAVDPVARLRRALRRVADDDLLGSEYLALRLQLWSLASVDPTFNEINEAAQRRYLSTLTTLLRAARPDLSSKEATRRATEVLVIQNGIWLTTAILHDRSALRGSVERCEEIALAPSGPGR